ncbi:beta strand repeat-containing protein [Colwellia sp. MB02u-10]|uniref:beta strand repeat-containing protein n=1 Tax=Colwellia sp. MB02u-10 TaxID=2759828 RepID=UPI0038556EB2
MAGDITVHAAGATVTIAGKGDLTIKADGTYDFTPVVNFNGSVPTATYTIQDNTDTSDTDTSTLAITVNAFTDGDETHNTNEDTNIVGANLFSDLVDADSTSHSITTFTVAGDTTVHAAGATVTIAGKGDLTIKADGTYDFTPVLNFNGSVPTATYTIQDNTDTSDTDTSTLTITVAPVNDAPVAVDDAINANEDTPFTSTVDLDFNDTDLDGDTLSVTAGTFTTANGGTLVLAADGSYTYTPLANFNGTDTVNYTVTDGTLTDVGQLTITVAAAPTVISVGDAGGFGDNVTVDEGALAVFTVTLSSATSFASSYDLGLTNDTAQITSDYLTVNGVATSEYTDAMKFSNGVTLNDDGTSVSVPTGVSSFTVTVRTVDDAVVETTDETFNLNVGGQTGIGTILDNDSPPTINHIGDASGSVNNVTVLEGISAVFTVSLSHATTAIGAYDLVLTAGSANLTSDYTNAMVFSDGVTYDSDTGQISVPIGVTSFTVTVPTTNDTDHEPTEAFTLSIGDVGGANTAAGTGTITDNDAVPTITHVGDSGGSINNVTVVEGVTAEFTVNLSGTSATATSFALALNNGSALLGADYTNAMTFSSGASYDNGTGLVTVSAGTTSFTVTVPTLDDTIDESDQTFVLSVGGVAGTGSITDNDMDAVPEVNTVPGGQITAEDVALVFSTSTSNPITVASDVTTTTISIASGTLTASISSGATITNDGSESVTITGTTAQINDALDGLIYAGTADYNGSVILTVTSTGAGSVVTTGNVAINMTPVVDITDDSVSYTPTSTGFCDTVPADDTPIVDGQAALSTASDTYTVGSTSTDTVIHGLGGNDTITTTSTSASNNSIVTLEGNDTITTTTVDGNNVICAGDGNNIITTTVTGTGGNFVGMGKGNDTMTTTNVNGHNMIMAGDGNNTITTTTTGSGNTKVVAGTGNDTITTTNVGGGSSTILSGAGNDTVSTGAGADLVVSGAGNDTVTTTGGADIVLSGSGNDTVTSGEGNDIVLSAAGNDTIAAGAGNDIIFSGSGNDRINAAAGADIIDSGAGNDIIWLGTGDGVEDVVIFGSTATANGSDAITQFTSGTDKLNLDAMTTQTATTAVNGALTVTAGNVYFLSTNVATAASTAALSATALEGGADWTNANVGDVAFFIVSAPNGSAIYQYVEAGTAGINVAELTLMGTIDDTITTSDLVFEANTDAATGLAAGLAGLASTEEAPSVSSLTIDVLANDAFENTGTITAVNGSAITQGGAAVAVDNGSVTLVDAKLVFTPTLVTYNGIATFTYTVTSGGVSETANVNVQVGPVVDSPVEDTLKAESYSLVMGVAGAETLAGSEGHDLMFGVEGADVFNALGGDDILWGTPTGADTMNAGDGNDILWGLGGAETMNAGDGNDTMHGGLGADIMNGDAGNDFIDGGTAADTMNGGAGNDTIVFGTDDTVIDGGDDTDTLLFSSATSIDLATLTLPKNFEIIDLSKNGNHTLSNITLDGVIAITDSNKTLTILKDDADTVTLDGTWTKSTTDTSTIIDGVSRPMDSYTHASDPDVTLKVVTIPADTTDVSQEIMGTTGADILTGGTGHDLMDGGTGNDILVGGAGGDLMFGGTGVDSLNGGENNDIILGGTGEDTLIGGAGSDNLIGGTDRDTFKWNLNETGSDFIQDFSLGTTGDVLDLADLLVGESSDAASLDDYLNFSASTGGGTLITVDTNGSAAGGEGQTITLDNIAYTDLQTYAGGTGSNTDIIAEMLSDNSLIVSS